MHPPFLCTGPGRPCEPRARGFPLGFGLVRFHSRPPSSHLWPSDGLRCPLASRCQVRLCPNASSGHLGPARRALIRFNLTAVVPPLLNSLATLTPQVRVPSLYVCTCFLKKKKKMHNCTSKIGVHLPCRRKDERPKSPLLSRHPQHGAAQRHACWPFVNSAFRSFSCVFRPRVHL